MNAPDALTAIRIPDTVQVVAKMTGETHREN